MATTIEVKLLFSLEMQVDSANLIGDIGGGTRAIGDVSGRFEGPGIKGTITATDWYLARPDGIGEADVRGMIKTDDDALIYMRYGGLVDMRHGTIAAGAATPVRAPVRCARRSGLKPPRNATAGLTRYRGSALARSISQPAKSAT